MLVLFVGATATVVVASDVITSRPFCPTCESTSTPNADAVTFEDALAEVAPGTGGIERSTLAVQFYPNGTARWTARNRLPPDVAVGLRDNTTLRQRILDRIEFEETPVGEPEQLTLRVENDTAIVSFVDPDGGSHRFGGVLFVTAHKATGHVDTPYDIWWSMNADRVTISGPPGWVVTQRPGGRLSDFRIVNETIVWQTPPGEPSEYHTIQPDEAYAFAPSAGVGAATFTTLHRVTGGIPAATVWLLVYGSLPAIVLLGGLVLVGRGVRWRLNRDRPVGLRWQSAGVCGLGLVASSASILYGPLVGAGLVYLFVGGCGYLIARADEPATPRLLGGVATLAVVLATTIWMLVFGLERDSLVMEIQALTVHVSALSMLALSLPFGAYWQAGERYRSPLLVILPFVLLVVATGVPSFPDADVWIPLGVFTATALVVALAGAPLAYLGASLNLARR